MKRRIRYIGTRLIVSAAIMIALLVGALSIVTFMMHRDDLMDHVTMHANQLSDIVQRSLYYSMLRYDRNNIEETISQIGREEGIEIARIFNKSGEIIYSSVAADVGVVVDINEEGCIECHAGEVPLVELHRGERIRIISGSEHRSLRVVTPIYNEPACESVDCHPSPTEQNVLGVLYMGVGLRYVDQQIERSAMLVGGFTAIIVIVLSIFLAYFVRRFIRRPVIALRQGVQRVAAGDLDHQIPVKSKTEIGELASSFNQMTVDLKKAREEIEEWGHNLEHRVQERTAELAETQAQLLQSEKLSSLGKLAASVAHEINNPLMGILTFIRIFQDWIKDGRFPPAKHPEFSRNLEIMGKETTRISKIVRNLLAFARRSKLEKREHQINELLKQCVELLDHQLSLQEIDIVFDLAPDLPQLYVDGGQIQQALMNLLLNAAEAMGKNGTLTLVSARGGDGKTVSIKVADTGPGIPEDIMDKLFDPFFTTKEVGKGTGLGLPVTYGIIYKHGGTIRVRSTLGEGSEFEILLPISPEEARDVDEEAEGPEVP